MKRDCVNNSKKKNYLKCAKILLQTLTQCEIEVKDIVIIIIRSHQKYYYKCYSVQMVKIVCLRLLIVLMRMKAAGGKNGRSVNSAAAPYLITHAHIEQG